MKRDSVDMPVPVMKLTDIYYVIFRQKWLIGGFLAAGLIAGLVVYLAQQTLYWSEAKLLVRYVTETKSMETGMGPQVKSAEVGGETILNSEMEILTTFDLCEEVAKVVGPDKILAKSGGGSNSTAAAGVIFRGLSLENPRRSNIIKVRFSHPDATICQVVLRQLITSYFKRHGSIHHTEAQYEQVLTEKAQTLLGQIRINEEEFGKLSRKAGVSAGVNSIEEAKKNKGDQLARLQQQLFDAQEEMAEVRSMVGATPLPGKNDKDSLDSGAPSDKVAEYKRISSHLETMRNEEFEQTRKLTDENPIVVRLRNQIIDTEKKKKALETEFPKLAALYIPPSGAISTPGELRLDPRRVAALGSRISVITNQMGQVRAELSVVDNLESSIADLKRKLELDGRYYKSLMAEIEGIQRNTAIANVSNIQAVQTPTPPAPNVSQRLKLVAGTFSGLLIAGILAAFFVEKVVDHTIRRPGEFEARMRLPLFLSIPKLGLNGHSKMLPFPAPAPAPASGPPAGGAEIALKQTWAADHPLREYIDGLRDATLTHFGGDPHKPKLIGITSCSDQSGVTSIAAGLAGALSETGDGNVLLLNLNFDAEAAHPFYRGELGCGLADAMELDKRHHGKVLQNLYVATAGNPNDPATQSLPKQLARIVPKLRVCDYDYIVFDLPPTTPTTMTARLAGMMDLVILVVESEKDTQDTVKQASKLLARSKAPVSAVLNKVRNPVPQWLQKGA